MEEVKPIKTEADYEAALMKQFFTAWKTKGYPNATLSLISVRVLGS